MGRAPSPGVVAALQASGEKVVVSVEPAFMTMVLQDPVVQDWLISVSEIQKTRDEYAEHLARFLQWAGMTPQQIFQIKKEAMKQGVPNSAVEATIRRFHEVLRHMEYAGKTRAKMVVAISSFVQSQGYTLPKKLVRLDTSDKLEMRVPEREEIEHFLEYAGSLQEKALYTFLTESPCRPRVYPALRWNWLEPNWWDIEFVHVNLPKQFRPGTQGGGKKFEPIMFLGPRSVSFLKQLRDAKIRKGHTPMATDRILTYTPPAMLAAVRRDFDHLVTLSLIRPSRTDETGEPVEQPLTPKSWRKYQFNLIDSLTDISPEWRKMLKGRDLQTERYYSKENIEALRKIYRDRIYPRLWTETATYSAEAVKALRQEVEGLKTKVDILEQISGRRVLVE